MINIVKYINSEEMDLEKLNRIKQVEAPEYLFTRITQSTHRTRHESGSMGFVWSLSFAFTLFVCVNATVFYTSRTSSDFASVMVRDMNISSANELYK